MKPDEEKTRVTVSIYGTQYKMKGSPEMTPEYIKEIAAYVDGKMRTIAGDQKNLDLNRLSVLSALYIANEYFDIKDIGQENEILNVKIQKLESENELYMKQTQEKSEKEELLLQEISQLKKYQQKLEEDLKDAWQQKEQAKDKSDQIEDKYSKLQDAFNKLKSEYNEWIELAEKELTIE
ncbi:cell division protein ZapA [Chengkuizengella axinellae]|uniref:Cell division protein ZapA n=1 Tax=Chengkuizengella axinellae TaxID=3064388 RepID=A0ABT9J4Q0_9BACL|nr:cell division protein ZapA [Chengkuizengella sp. 2205SS18-9]MDP5276597.1 cell division protein ZapA [Chengkuizengella sp. 2205SS18-9]